MSTWINWSICNYALKKYKIVLQKWQRYSLQDWSIKSGLRKAGKANMTTTIKPAVAVNEGREHLAWRISTDASKEDLCKRTCQTSSGKSIAGWSLWWPKSFNSAFHFSPLLFSTSIHLIMHSFKLLLSNSCHHMETINPKQTPILVDYLRQTYQEEQLDYQCVHSSVPVI